MNMLNELETLVPAPANPLDVDEAVLEQNEKVIGITFPDDFVQYGLKYGSGQVSVKAYSWEIWSACRITYPKIVKEFHDTYYPMREALETYDISLGLFPEP